MTAHPLHAMFNPTSVAVFGASAAGNSVGARVFANLLQGGFAGRIVAVNPKYTGVSGQPCVARAADLDAPVDLALIATPAPSVPGIIADCGAAGIRNAVVLSAGFAEAGEAGRARSAALKKAARENDVRLLGPNCVGLVLPHAGFNGSFLNIAPPPGRLALLSQSGALCSAISDWAGPNDLGFSAVVSMGNAAMLDFGDLVDYLAQDASTDAILLYVEGVRDAPGFIDALHRATAIKPVVVLKSGRHTAGSHAASTHTGALIGSDAVFDAALERTGAVRAQTFGQLFAAAEMLAPNTPALGPGLCILTNGGGAGVLAADRAGDLLVDLPMPGPATLAALDGILPPYWSHANPVDILGDASAETYGAVLDACLADPAFHGVLVMLTPQAMTDADSVARAVIAAAARVPEKPVLACFMGAASVGTARAALSAAGIPDFTTPERAVEAFSFLAQHHRNRSLAASLAEAPARARGDGAAAQVILAKARAEGRSMLSDPEAKAVLGAFAIPVCPATPAATADAAVAAAKAIGGPVALKIASPQISHKTEVDGVHLNLATEEAVRAAFAQITATATDRRPDARIDGVTVEPMARISDAREVVIGASRDPVFGPAVMFGAGGTLVEVMQDTALALPPLTPALAQNMIARTRISRALGPFRGKPAADRAALVRVLLAVSDLLDACPGIAAMDLNPVLVGPGGLVCVDARISLEDRDPSQGGARDAAP